MTINSFKGNMVKDGDLVDVYVNLHTDYFSIRDSKTRIVLSHGENFIIENATFHVGEKSQKRVKKEMRKNVHAYVKGTIRIVSDDVHEDNLEYIRYNPYETKHFEIDGKSLQGQKVDKVYCTKQKVYKVK